MDRKITIPVKIKIQNQDFDVSKETKILRENIAGYDITLEVTFLSKWKTTIQLIACGSFLVWRTNTFSYNVEALGIISYTFLWVAAIITLITGIQYIMKLVLFFKNNKNES